MVKQFHMKMKGRHNFSLSLSEPIAIDNGVKQGDIPALTFFSIFFIVALMYAFQDWEGGIYLHFWTTSIFFYLSTSKAFQSVIRQSIYADDTDPVAHTGKMHANNHDAPLLGSILFGLTINIKLAMLMYTPRLEQRCFETCIFV